MQQHCSHIFNSQTPRPWGWGQWVNVQLFHYMVMVHINLKRITKCSNMVAIILAADPHSFTTLGMGSIGQNSTLSEHDHVVYQIKWNHEMQQHGSKHFARRPPPPPHTHTHTRPETVNWSKFNFFRTWSSCILIKGNHECTNMVANIFHAEPPPPPPRSRTLGY